MTKTTPEMNFRQHILDFAQRTEDQSLRLMDTEKDRELVRICLKVMRLAASQIPVDPPQLKVMS